MAGLFLLLIKCVSHKSHWDDCWKRRFRQGISKTPPREKSLNASHATRCTPTVQKIKKRRQNRENPRKGWQTSTCGLQFYAAWFMIIEVQIISSFIHLLLPRQTDRTCNSVTMWAAFCSMLSPVAGWQLPQVTWTSGFWSLVFTFHYSGMHLVCFTVVRGCCLVMKATVKVNLEDIVQS